MECYPGVLKMSLSLLISFVAQILVYHSLIQKIIYAIYRL